MDPEAILILMLSSFIIGLMIGVILARPQAIR